MDNLETKIDLIYKEILDTKAKLNEFVLETRQHFDKIEKRLDWIEDQQREDRKVIMEMWRDREKVTVTFSKTFAFINIFIASVVSGFVAYFVKR